MARIRPIQRQVFENRNPGLNSSKDDDSESADSSSSSEGERIISSNAQKVSPTAQSSASLRKIEPRLANVRQPKLDTEPCNHFKNQHVLILLLLGLLVTVPAILWGLQSSNLIHLWTGSSKDSAFINAMREFESSFKNLGSTFKNKESRTYDVLASAILQSMQEQEPRDPACILIIGKDEMKKTTHCFAEKLTDIVHHAFQNLPHISGNKLLIQSDQLLQDGGSGGTLLRMRKLVAPLEANQTYTILVTDLELLPPETWSFFHSYCDNDNSIFKRLVMVITVNLPNLSNDNPSKVDVYKMWKNELSEERIAALDTRMGNHKVLLTSETLTECKS